MGRPAFNPVRDLVSGIIMAATSVPQLIAYAETVGYAGYRGLATAGAPLIAWGMTTGSPFMNAGVTSITALMAKSDLDGESYVQEHGEGAYVLLVAAYSLYIGLASILLAVVGFGRLAKSVPVSVRRGFKWGCSVGVLIAAVPNGLFMNGSRELKSLAASSELIAEYIVTPLKGSFPGAVNVTHFLYAMTHPGFWGIEPAVMFIFGCAWCLHAKNYLPSFLPPGTEVILLTAVTTLYSIQTEYQGGTVGTIPVLDPESGISLGPIKIPIEFLDLKKLVTEVPLVERFGSYAMLALSSTIFAAVNFLSIMGIASGFESENGIAWSAERELTAQGTGCILAAAVGSAPVSGSMSRSLVSRMTGTTSQLACIVTALAWIYLQPYMSIMTPTPKAALSAVILSAVLKTVCFPKDLLKTEGIDFLVGWGTGIATAATSPTQGFGIGLVLYFATSVLRSKPKTA